MYWYTCIITGNTQCSRTWTFLFVVNCSICYLSCSLASRMPLKPVLLILNLLFPVSYLLVDLAISINCYFVLMLFVKPCYKGHHWVVLFFGIWIKESFKRPVNTCLAYTLKIVRLGQKKFFTPVTVFSSPHSHRGMEVKTVSIY